MKKSILLLTCGLLVGQTTKAQSLTTVTGKRLYEHHSPSIAGPLGANGFQSAYDFVNHTYVYSFDKNTFSKYTDGTDTAIDMVEHNGAYGNGGLFGFTSDTSTIWGNSLIRGNGITKWMEAPGSFNYGNANTIGAIVNAYNSSTASTDINVVGNNKVYIGRIRNSQLYVAVRCYNINNGGSSSDTYFDFDYKYGVNTTGIDNTDQSRQISVYPNPATWQIIIRNTSSQPLKAKIMSVEGQEIQTLSLATNEVRELNISDLPKGLYVIMVTVNDGSCYMQKIIKQ